MIKPLLQLEKGIHSANHYRRYFRKLVKAKGSKQAAFAAVKQVYRESGFRAAKIYLRDFVDVPEKLHLNDGVVILATQHTFYIAKLFSQALNKIHIENKILLSEPKKGYSGQLHIVICPQMFAKLPEKYIAFQMEQSVSSRWFTEDYFNRLKNAKFVFDYAMPNLQFLQDNGIPFKQLFYVPVGLLENSQEKQPESHSNFEYDVAFYGDANCERRQFFLKKLQEKFSVKIISEVFGDELYQLLNKAKIVVNIHYYENALLETTRIYECLSLNKLLISEVGSDQAEHKNLDGLVDFVEIDDVDGMIQRIDYWLSHTKEFNQRIEEIKQARNQPNQFQFFFYRFLLSQDLMEFDHFYQLCGNYVQPKGDFWCLSLPESTVRRQDFKKDNHYNIEIIDGLRHQIGWVGCGLSYKFMMKRAEDLKLPQVTICEDDVLFYPKFFERYENIRSNLLNTKEKWDIFSGLVSDLSEYAKVSLSPILLDNEKVYNINMLISMVFNIYSSNCYSKICNWNDKYRPASLSNTIDRYIQDSGTFKGLIISPFLVGHKEDLDSTLWGHSNDKYNLMIENSQNLLDEKISALSVSGFAKNKNSKKKILLVMPDHVGLYHCIRKNLEYYGFEVTEAIISGNTINYEFPKIKNSIWHDRTPLYDYALVIRGDLFVPSGFLEKIKPYIKNEMVAYQWDYMNRFPLIWQAVPLFKKFFVFDMNDYKNNKNQFLPLTNFYFDYNLKNKTNEKFDFYFLGCHVEGREHEIQLFAKTAKENHWTLDFEIVAPSENDVQKWRSIYPFDNIRIGTRFYSFQENLANMQYSKVLVDFKTPGQEGLSFRCFEALGSRKKLITTNTNIRHYDFYHPNNIFIWDGNDLTGLSDFLALPYVEIDNEIREKYGFGNWIKYVLNIEDFNAITLP